jgi:YVTN family beta-propeller protein
LILVLSADNMVHAELTTTIQVGTIPQGLAYDSAKGEIFVANPAANAVSVISDITNTVIATINVGSDPSEVAYDSIKGEIFVTNSLDSTVSVISDSNNTVVATVAVENYPSAIAYDSSKGEIFVACSHNSVSIISDSNNTVVATVAVGNNPKGMAYDYGKGEMFVTNAADNTVSVISDSNNMVVATVDMVPQPNLDSSLTQACAAAYDPEKGEIYVAITDTQMVSVISDSTDAVIENISVTIPQDIIYGSGTNNLFVLNRGSPYVSGLISIISDNSNTVVAKVDLQGFAYKIAYDSGTNEIFVTDANNTTVSVISLSSITYTSPSPTPSLSPSPSASPTSTMTVSPSPTVPEFSNVATIVVLLFFVSTAGLLVYFKKYSRSLK